MIENVDSIISPLTGQQIPPEVMAAPSLLGYVAGNQADWHTYGPYAAARPDLAAKGWIVSVTLTCLARARCFDIEPGGGSNGNIGVFMRNADRTWGLPWLYTFASNGAAMLAAAASFGFEQGRDYYYLAAHPNSSDGEHICSPSVCGYPSADGTQYDFASAFDRSILNDYMLPNVTPKPPDPYAMFPTDLPSWLPNRGNERLTVEQADGALQHGQTYRGYLKGQLYGELRTFRDRIWRVSVFEPPDFTRPRPVRDWSNDRGSRWQAINNRMKRIDEM